MRRHYDSVWKCSEVVSECISIGSDGENQHELPATRADICPILFKAEVHQDHFPDRYPRAETFSYWSRHAVRPELTAPPWLLVVSREVDQRLIAALAKRHRHICILPVLMLAHKVLQSVQTSLQTAHVALRDLSGAGR